MRSKHIAWMCETAVFAAIIYVFTAYLHIPSHTGYTHVGDGFLYLAGSLLPAGYAAAAGAIGAALADCLTGYAIWAPASIVIKAVTALFFTAKARTVLCKRNFAALIPALALCVGGYYFYESVITGNFVAPLAGIPGYCTQVVLSSVLYVLVGLALDKIRFKDRLMPVEQKNA